MTLPTERVIALLEEVSQTGTDRWMALCPAHQDGTASLSIREGDDGRVLLHCFAGCGAGEVIDALGSKCPISSRCCLRAARTRQSISHVERHRRSPREMHYRSCTRRRWWSVSLLLAWRRESGSNITGSTSTAPPAALARFANHGSRHRDPSS